MKNIRIEREGENESVQVCESVCGCVCECVLRRDRESFSPIILKKTINGGPSRRSPKLEIEKKKKRRKTQAMNQKLLFRFFPLHCDQFKTKTKRTTKEQLALNDLHKNDHLEI